MFLPVLEGGISGPQSRDLHLDLVNEASLLSEVVWALPPAGPIPEPLSLVPLPVPSFFLGLHIILKPILRGKSW